MINHAHRFHGRRAIQRLYSTGRTVRTAGLSVRVAPNPRGTYRVAVIVSRKISKSAVVRNRIRRRIYEQVRLLFATHPAPYDLAVTVFDEKLAEAPAPVLAAEVQKLLAKAQFAPTSPAAHAIVERKS